MFDHGCQLGQISNPSITKTFMIFQKSPNVVTSTILDYYLVYNLSHFQKLRIAMFGHFLAQICCFPNLKFFFGQIFKSKNFNDHLEATDTF